MQQVLSKKLKYLLILPLLFTAFAGALAQSLTVKGRVNDENGGSLPGVTVLVKGTTNGTATDADGNYSLSVPNGNATLIVSFIGYSTQEVGINNRTTVNISLKPDAKALDEVEVVFIGYSAVSKDALTGSVSSVGGKQLEVVPVSTAAEALAGRLAGVQVTTTEGRPGAEVQIRVRGGGSITQDNSPLYIVDGIRVDNALSIISPQEIQSIDVLKDAASTTIDNFVINNSVLDSLSNYGVLTVDNAACKVNNISIKNSTIYKAEKVITSRQNSVSLVLENCTINEAPLGGDTNYLIDYSTSATNTVSGGIIIANCILGIAKSGVINNRIVKGIRTNAATQISVSNTFKT
jgi:hypothetical protein